MALKEFDPRSVTDRWSGRATGQGEKEIDAGSAGLGSRWYIPDDEARERLHCYRKAEQLLDVCQHYQLFTALGGQQSPPAESAWIPIDFPGTLSRLVRHYGLGPDFGVSAKTKGSDAAVQAISEKNAMPLLLRQVCEAMPSLGDAVLRVDVVDYEDPETGEMRPRACVKFVHPGHYFPRFSPMDGTEAEEVTLAWVIPKPETAGSVTGLWPFKVLREVHTPGRVDYYLNEWNGKELGPELDVASEFPQYESGDTGIPEIPIVHVGFNVAGGEHFGRSAFKRIERIFLALENRLAQEDEILERHARPKLIVGPGVLNQDARTNLADFDVIEIDPDVLNKAVKPEYLTWDPQIAAIKHEIDKLEEYFFMTTETSPSSFGLERDGSQVESGRALRFKAHRTINMVEDLRDALGPAIKSVYRIAQLMERAALAEDDLPVYALTEIDVAFPDPVIEDETQEAQDYALLKTAGLVSRKRAVGDLFDLTPDEAEAEVREILQDMTDDAASVPTAAPAPAPETDIQPGEPVPPTGTPAAEA